MMLALLLCCMMKIVEFSTGTPVADRRLHRRYKKRAQYRRGKAMSEVGVGVRITAHTPDSDCNSNHPGSNSCLSNASSQDIDFIQDNSDYQWFLDYKDGSTNHHTSILSLSEAYDANDVGYYDALAKNMDANLAEADMESFKTEDIHALLTNLPTMCTDPISQDTRQGESFASVSGSMMANIDFDSSISPHSSSHGEDSANSTSMSICKSELLFSPVKEVPMPGANFSVDSLDCELMTEHDIMLTCQANKDNYTIAFEGSLTMYSEDNDFHDADKSESVSKTDSSRWSSNIKTQTENIKRVDTSMVQSDSGGFTTWSKLRKLNSDNQLRRHPSGNNNTSEDNSGRFNATNNAMKSQSMPNLYKQKIRGLLGSNYLKNQNLINSLIDPSLVKRRSVKVFDIQHQLNSNSLSGGSGISEMATSADGGSTSSESQKHQQQNFNLVKLFMKQKSLSAEGMSTAMDQSSISENWPTQSGASHESHDGKQSIEAKLSYFEDNLLVDTKTAESSSRTHDLIIEEQDEDISRSESIEQITESLSKLDSTGGESFENAKFNINNNNSFENDVKIKRKLKVHSTQTRKSNNVSTSSTNSSSSQSSFTCSERPNFIRNHPKSHATQVPVHLMNKSMQTSIYVDKNLINAPYKLNCHNSKDNIKVVEPSFLKQLNSEVKIEKPVYVVYPNYVLPDLDFLNHKPKDLDKIILMPQKGPTKTLPDKKRPYSLNDLELLKQKGFNHINDWDSLNFLLPQEYRQILAEIPEIAQQIKTKPITEKPSFCNSGRSRARPVSCTATILERIGSGDQGTSHSSSSSTATQPSSGYRGSSTMLLSDSQNSPGPTNTFNPLFVYRYDSVTSSEASLKTSERQKCVVTTTAPPLPKRSISLSQESNMKGESVPPRPPLPRGILRKTLENAKLHKHSKRHSMFDVTENETIDDLMTNKRYSFQEQAYSKRNKRLSETEDEGVDAGTSSSSLDEQLEGNIKIPIHHKTDALLSMINGNELQQLEEYLKINGISLTDSDELDEEGVMQLRSCISKFVVLKLNEQSGDQLGGKKTVSFAVASNIELKPPNNSPNASTFGQQKQYHCTNLIDMPIREETETNLENYLTSYPVTTHTKRQTYDLNQKRLLINAVPDGIEKLIHNFATATNQTELSTLGNSSYNPACAKIALTSLCPTIYAILSDGLKSNLETSFGPISNSVWQVVEASAQQGPLTKALNDLVMKINSEDVITEGLVKFNAFILGLLNVRSLDAWISYLRTRESILKKHYNPDSLLLLAHTGGAAVRGLLDTLVVALEPLALLPFQFDLLFEYRQLHQSLNRIDSYHQLNSPTRPKLPSPTSLTSKQWNYAKYSQQCNLGQSTSDTEDISTATTVKHLSPEHTNEALLPDLLNSSSSSSTKVSHRPEKVRPRSCVEPAIAMKTNFRVGDDVASTAKKRWSGISLSSKLYQAFDRLANEEEEEYTDSLENCTNRTIKACKQDEKSSGSSNEGIPYIPEDAPESLDSNVSDEKPLNGKRFKKLQQKWEMLSGKESYSPPSSPVHRSKIPVPVTSPSQQSGIPVSIISPTSKLTKKVISPLGGNKKVVGVVKSCSGSNIIKNGAAKKNNQNSRTSRLDQLTSNNDPAKHVPRPSSLPYKPVSVQNKASKIAPSRRAVSTSLSRKPTLQTQTSKMVRTLSHRLPSESGHLSYNEGESLKVILEVDEKWLLCCRGTQKGLVPRSGVIADTGRF